jgi:hypothetical protein
MDELTVRRTFAAVTTIVAAAMVAANWDARVTVSGFAIFIIAAIAWAVDGWLESKSSLIPKRDSSPKCLAVAAKGREGIRLLGVRAV